MFVQATIPRQYVGTEQLFDAATAASYCGGCSLAQQLTKSRSPGRGVLDTFAIQKCQMVCLRHIVSTGFLPEFYPQLDWGQE